MKKTLMLIIFTAICFILSLNNVYAEKACYGCYFPQQSNIKEYHWSDGEPTDVGSKRCIKVYLDEEHCKGEHTDNYLEEIEKEQAEETCWACYYPQQRNFQQFYWSKNKPAAAGNQHCDPVYIDQEHCEGEHTEREVDEMDGNPEYYENAGNTSQLPPPGFGQEMSCSELLGSTLTKLIKTLLDLFKFACVALCIVQMMIKLIPPITSKDPDALNKAIKSCVTLLIILTCALLIDTFVVIIGRLFGFDLSCFS